MKQRLRAAALALALALCFGLSLRSWRQANLETPNEALGGLSRFAGIIRAIPGNGIIGYFSDRGEAMVLPTPPFSVRYAFAPRMLVWYPDLSVSTWVVGDFIRHPDYLRAGEQLGLHLVRDFGDGVVLYRR